MMSEGPFSQLPHTASATQVLMSCCAMLTQTFKLRLSERVDGCAGNQDRPKFMALNNGEPHFL